MVNYQVSQITSMITQMVTLMFTMSFLKQPVVMLQTYMSTQPDNSPGTKTHTYHLITDEGIKYMWGLEREREKKPERKLGPKEEAENRILYYLFRCGEMGSAPSRYDAVDIIKENLGLGYIEARKRAPEILRGLQARDYIVKTAEEVREFIRPQAQEFLYWVATGMAT